MQSHSFEKDSFSSGETLLCDLSEIDTNRYQE